MFIYVLCIYSAFGSQKRALGPLGLNFSVVSLGARNSGPLK